jgi:hypothetical protein
VVVVVAAAAAAAAAALKFDRMVMACVAFMCI